MQLINPPGHFQILAPEPFVLSAPQAIVVQALVFTRPSHNELGAALFHHGSSHGSISQSWHFFQPVHLNNQLSHLAFKPGFFFLLLLGPGFLAAPSFKYPGRRLQHLAFSLRHLHGIQVVVCRDLLHRLDCPERLQHYLRLELQAVVSFLLFYVSVGLGFILKTRPKRTISLETFLHTTSALGVYTF